MAETKQLQPLLASTAIALSPLLSVLVAIPTSMENVLTAQPRSHVVGLDTALAGCLVTFFAFTQSHISLNSAVAVAGLCMWTTGVSSMYDSVFLVLELCIVFYLLGKDSVIDLHEEVYDSLPKSTGMAFVLTTGFIWMNSFQISFVIALVYVLMKNVKPILKRSHGATVTSLAYLMLQVCIGVLGQWEPFIASLFAYSLTAWTVAASKEAVELAVAGLGLSIAVYHLNLWSLHVVIIVLICIRLMDWVSRKNLKNNNTLLFLLPFSRELLISSPGVSRLGILDSHVTVWLASVMCVLLWKGLDRVFQYWTEQSLDLGKFIQVLFFILAFCSRIIQFSGKVFMPYVFGPIGVTMVLGVPYIICNRSASRTPRHLPALFIGVLMWALALLFLASETTGRWYEIPVRQRSNWCSELSLSDSGYWVEDTSVQSKTRSVSEVNMYVSLETSTCRTTFPPATDELLQKRVTVIGDSVGRFIFYALANEANSTYGFPKATFHGNINASETLSFVWSPYANDLSQSIRNQSSAEILVISCGLWDKLWHRDPDEYKAKLDDFFRGLHSMNGNVPLVVWIELTAVQDENLFGDDKIKYLTEATAPIWREKARDALNQFSGRIVYVPTLPLTSARVSRDGVHYDMHTYQAIVATMLRGVQFA